MTLPIESRPQKRAGYWTWPVTDATCEIFFVGKGPQRERSAACRAVAPDRELRLSWLRQQHTPIVREAGQAGLCGIGDALMTDRPSTVLSIATADCVPIVIAGDGRLAVVHAGWRGLARQIIEATLERFPGPRSALRAWIGPSVGACCYEVDWDVAAKVGNVSHPAVVLEGNERPRLDLAKAARVQLQQGDVKSVHSFSVCTKCSSRWLWSHRRDHPNVGRNWTFAWMNGDLEVGR